MKVNLAEHVIARLQVFLYRIDPARLNVHSIRSLIDGERIETSNDLLNALDVSQGNLTTYAIVAMGLGIIVVLVGFALRAAANWARLLVAIVAVARLISLLWVVISLHSVHWYYALWPTVIYLLVAGYLLFDEDAKAYFGQPA